MPGLSLLGKPSGISAPGGGRGAQSAPCAHSGPQEGAAAVGGITALPSCASLLLLGRLPAATRESTRAERKEGPVGAWGLCTPADPGGDAPHP